jgi:ABC-type dipeptide/oligopeptide/nickel transport system ATPase component
MPVRLDRNSADFAQRFAGFLAMKREVSADIESATRAIVDDVAARGDLALIEATRKFRPAKGEVPSPINPPSGCVFHPRCPMAVEGCSRARPTLRELRPGHWVACSEVQ